MTIKKCLIIAALFIAIGASAQEKPFTVGVKAGLNLSNMGGDLTGTDDKVGFQIGFTVDYALKNDFCLISGLSLSSKGFKISNVLIDEDYPSGSMTLNPVYLEIPLHVGYKLSVAEDTRLVFETGPYLAYGVAGKATVKAGSEKESVNAFSTMLLNEFDCGFGFGAGVEFGKFAIKLGYDFGFANSSNQDDLSEGGKLKNLNGYLTFGYRF
jgi:hypothetical protein